MIGGGSYLERESLASWGALLNFPLLFCWVSPQGAIAVELSTVPMR